MRMLIAEIFAELDEKIFLWERDKENFIVHAKRIRHIETIFGDIAFYRRYYFDKKSKKYIYLLDKKLDIDKGGRIYKHVKLWILENATAAITYKELIKMLHNTHISVMSVSNILNKTKLAELSDFLIDTKDMKKLPITNNVIYLQVDDTFQTIRSKIKKTKALKSGKVVRAKNWKTIRVLSVHTGHVPDRHPNASKMLANKRIFTFAPTPTQWSWTKAIELCKQFYEINDTTEIYFCGDGATWIQYGSLELEYPFVIDAFHIIREYSRILNHKNKKEHDDILEKSRKYFYKGEYENLYELTSNFKTMDELNHKLKRINKLLNYLVKNKAGIEIYKQSKVIGCSIEGDNFNYIKRFFGKRKTFNDASLTNILIAKLAIKNKIPLLPYMKFETKEKNLEKIQEIINLKWKYQTINVIGITEGEFVGNSNRYYYKKYLHAINQK